MPADKQVEFELRPMEQRDIPAGMRLKEAAGWNQLEQDWELFLESSKTGSLVAEYMGKIVGSVTSVNYDRRFSWIGMVLVDPSARRMGLGTKLLKEAMRLSADFGAIRLDATPAGKQLYDTLGFKDEYNLNRYQLEKCDVTGFPDPGHPCHNLTLDDIEKVAVYDREIFGASRPKILRALCRMGPSYGWIRYDKHKISGYCLGRPGSNFEQIGPVNAQDFKTAISLVIHALRACHGKPVILDIPDKQYDFRALMEDIGFTIQRPFIRMYLGDHLHRGKPEYQFAIAGPEIG
jgi:GNAT superfamily N-acetyltransferase